DQYRCIGRGNGLYQLPKFLDLSGFANDLLQLVRFRSTGLEGSVLLDEPMPLSTACYSMKQFLWSKWLGKVIDGTGLDGFHSELRRGIGSDHQHGNIRPVLLEMLEKFVTTHSTQPGIGDHHEKLVPFQTGDGIL